MIKSVQRRAVACAAVCAVGLFVSSGQARIAAQEPPPLLQLRVVVQGPAPETDWEFTHEALGVSTFLPAAGTETFLAYPVGQWRLAQIAKANYRTAIFCVGGTWEPLSGSEVRIVMPTSGSILCSFTNTFEEQTDVTPTSEPSPTASATATATATETATETATAAATATLAPSTAEPSATVRPTRTHNPTKTPQPTKTLRPTKTPRPTKSPRQSNG